jgi:predicted nucleic acid-binding protein
LQLTISDWVVTEFSSALSIKLRMKHLSVEQRARAVSLFTNLKTRSLAIAPVTREHFQAAARFADQSGLGLRAGDALHVAVAAELGATLCTLDKRLAEAAVALGVSAEMA